MSPAYGNRVNSSLLALEHISLRIPLGLVFPLPHLSCSLHFSSTAELVLTQCRHSTNDSPTSLSLTSCTSLQLRHLCVLYFIPMQRRQMSPTHNLAYTLDITVTSYSSWSCVEQYIFVTAIAGTHGDVRRLASVVCQAHPQVSHADLLG